MTLEQVFDRARADAAVLRRRGHGEVALALTELCADAEKAAEDWLTWLSETQARERSGKSTDYFRDRRAQWALDDLARQVGRRWTYRRCIVPRSRLSGIQRAEAAMERAG